MVDWAGERYVRVFVRNSSTLHRVGWEGRAVLWELLRHCDTAGIFDSSDPAVIAEMIRMPRDVVAVGFGRLLESKVVEVVRDDLCVIVNYVDAQYSAAHPGARKRKQRSRAMAIIRSREVISATPQKPRKRDAKPCSSDDSSRNTADPSRKVTRAACINGRGQNPSVSAISRLTSLELSEKSPNCDKPDPLAAGPESENSENKSDKPVAPATVHALVANGGDRKRESDHVPASAHATSRDGGEPGADAKAKRLEAKRLEAREVAERFVRYLNSIANRRHRVTEFVRKRVARLLAEGFTAADFKRAVDSRWREWQGTDAEQFMRPTTILRLDKFPEYVEAADAPAKTERKKTAADLLPGLEIVR